MTETEFLERAERTLTQIETAIEASDLDVEATRAGNVLTLETADGARVVVNSQAPMQQLWLAARSGAWHFVLKEGRWRDTRSDAEFFEVLSRALSAAGEPPVVLRGD
jgi:CyaY protein